MFLIGPFLKKFSSTWCYYWFLLANFSWFFSLITFLFRNYLHKYTSQTPKEFFGVSYWSILLDFFLFLDFITDFYRIICHDVFHWFLSANLKKKIALILIGKSFLIFSLSQVFLLILIRQFVWIFFYLILLLILIGQFFLMFFIDSCRPMFLNFFHWFLSENFSWFFSLIILDYDWWFHWLEIICTNIYHKHQKNFLVFSIGPFFLIFSSLS